MSVPSRFKEDRFLLQESSAVKWQEDGICRIPRSLCRRHLDQQNRTEGFPNTQWLVGGCLAGDGELENNVNVADI